MGFACCVFCLFVVLIGVYFAWCGRIAAFLVGLLFSFVNDHLDEAVVVLSFPPSIFGSRILALFAATFVIHVLAGIDLGLFFLF